MCKVTSLLLITLTVFGCSNATPTNSFDDEVIEIINIINVRLEDKEDLSNKEKHKLELFVVKYSTESQTDYESLVTTHVALLYMHFSSILIEDFSSDRLEYMKKYNGTLEKIKELIKH